MFKAEKPPYDLGALKPHISKEQMDYHFNKHHKGYANKLNHLVKQDKYKRYAKWDVGRIIFQAQRADDSEIFNNAAQIVNHNIFWKSMSPDGGGRPKGKLFDDIEKQYGSWVEFTNKFIQSATEVFGSGWVWLENQGKGRIEITTTKDAETRAGDAVLLVLDVWEHAYYLDYKNNRAEFVQVFLDHLVNWKFAEKQYK